MYTYSHHCAPREAVDFHSSTPLEVVLEPGEVIVTMDYWHQVSRRELATHLSSSYLCV